LRIGGFIKKHLTLVGLAAVLVPLLSLLALQYGALSRLEETSPAARQLSLESRLRLVSDELDRRLAETARETLDVRPSAIIAESDDDDVSVFRNAPAAGVKRYFIGSLYKERRKVKVTAYDPATGTPSDDKFTPEMWAAYSAASHSFNLMMDRAVVDPASIEVDEKDPHNRIALRPIVDKESRIVGVAGLIADDCYYTTTYFHDNVEPLLAQHFSESELSELEVAVFDEAGVRRWSNCSEVCGDVETSVAMPYLFSKWKLALAARGPSHEQVARNYFFVNLTLTVLLIAIVAGAVVLSLRAAGRELRLSEMKTDFVSNVSHELRTPLASIRVFGELMRIGRVDDPDKIHEYGELIESESRRLTQLVNNILDFEKFELGQKTYSVETVDPVRLVDEALAAFVPQARQQGFEVGFNRPNGPVPTVSVDPGAVSQAILNLLDNAVKYSGDSRKVLVRVDRGVGNVRISVEDFGIGIPADEHAQIFTRFHRVSTSLVHDVKGSGLGLALVKYIVEAHGGRVTLTSTPGSGSTFTIHLPTANPQATAQSRVKEVNAAT
jgi:signal transduction histidine kinase